MGLLNWFINRRMAKERAATMGPDQAAVLAMQRQAAEQAGATQVTSLSDIGALLSQWQQFQQLAGSQGQAGAQVYDLRGVDGLRDEILSAVQSHGVPTDGTQVLGMAGAVNQDPHDLMGLQGDILGILAKHGVDVSALGVEQVPGAPSPAPPTAEADLPPIQDPLRRR